MARTVKEKPTSGDGQPNNGRRYVFKLQDEKRNQTGGLLEGDNISDILDEIGDRYGINPFRLSTFREMRDDQREVYVVLKGHKIIVEMQRLFKAHGKMIDI